MFIYTENTTNPINALLITNYNTKHTKNTKTNFKITNFSNTKRTTKRKLWKCSKYNQKSNNFKKKTNFLFCYISNFHISYFIYFVYFIFFNIFIMNSSRIVLGINTRLGFKWLSYWMLIIPYVLRWICLSSASCR